MYGATIVAFRQLYIMQSIAFTNYTIYIIALDFSFLNSNTVEIGTYFKVYGGLYDGDPVSL